MPDPFDGLRLPIEPATPRMTFAGQLRSRLVRALEVPRGMHHGDVGYMSLWVDDVVRAAIFFAQALGWEYEPSNRDDRRMVRGKALPLGIVPRLAAVQYYGALGFKANVPENTLYVSYIVDDLAVAIERVRAAGGQTAEPRATPHGVQCDCVDDQGMPFGLSQGTEATPPSDTHQGDLAYLTMHTVSGTQARDFYAAVLGWQSVAGRVADGWQVENVSPLVGIAGGHAHPSALPMYQVDDIEVAIRAVRAAGGTSTDSDRQPYGITAECVDDQNTTFYLGQFPK